MTRFIARLHTTEGWFKTKLEIWITLEPHKFRPLVPVPCVIVQVSGSRQDILELEAFLQEHHI